MQPRQLLPTPDPTMSRAWMCGKVPKKEGSACIPWEQRPPHRCKNRERREEGGGAFTLAVSHYSSQWDVRCGISLPGASSPSLAQGPAAFKRTSRTGLDTDPESPFLRKSRHLTRKVSSKLEQNVKIQVPALDSTFNWEKKTTPTQQFQFSWHSPTPALAFLYWPVQSTRKVSSPWLR